MYVSVDTDGVMHGHVHLRRLNPHFCAECVHRTTQVIMTEIRVQKSRSFVDCQATKIACSFPENLPV